MNKAKELFEKILVDGQEINLQQLDDNNGVYSVGEQKTLKVDFVLKKKDEIPAKIFVGLTSLKSVVVPESVKTIGAQAFANTGAEVSGLEQVETFGEGALVGTEVDPEILEEIQENNPEAFIERYTAAEAAEYNLTLNGAWQYGKIKVEGVEAVEAVEEVLYTNEEVDVHNANIEGTVKIDEPTEEIFINNYQNVEYIVDQQSWEDSFNNDGIMSKYYETYPDNDLIAIDGQKVASFNDRIYIGTITGENEEKRFKAGWSEKSQSLTNESNSNEVYYIKRLNEESPYYGTADEWKSQYDKFHGMSWQLYSDALLTTPIEGKEIYIRTLVFDGFTHTYAGMVANGGKLPWIGAWFTEEFDIDCGVHMIFKYEGKDDVRPWGDRVFGNGENQKVWGFASISDEFNDNALAIEDCGGEGAFDAKKFSLVLEKAEYETYTKESANEVNGKIEGAWQYDKVKVEGVEAVEAVEEVLYTNEEVDAHNAELNGAVKEGDIKTNVEETPNTGTLDVDYEVGYKYTLPLMYTERNGQKRIQEIGTAKVQIVEIDDNEEQASQYKLKIKVIEVNITNPLTGVNIDYESEILNRYFYTQDTFITADMNMFMTLPGFTGIESFFAMKGEGDTYHPELENFSGVTDYSIKRNTMELTPEID